MLGPTIFAALLALTPAPQLGPVYPLALGTYVDPSHGAAYIAKQGSFIQALDLRTGAELWESASAAVPIGGNDTYLAGQAEYSPPGTLALVFLDLRNGLAVSQANIPLPAGVTGLVGLSRTRGDFTAQAKPQGSDFLILWYHDDYVYNAPSGPAHRYAGSARIDPRSGTILTSDGGLVPDYPAWYHAGIRPSQPWHAGSVTATTSTASDGSITLKRKITATEQALPDVLLTSDAGATVLPSVDAAALIIEEKYATGGYRMRVVAIESGALIDDVIVPVLISLAEVVDGEIVTWTTWYPYDFDYGWTKVPTMIVAFSLSGGIQEWSVPIRIPEADILPPPRRHIARH